MTQPLIKEVFFDWDGTFANTEPVSLAVTHRVLSEYATQAFGKPMTAQIDSLDMRGKDFGQIAKQFQDLVNALLPATQQVTLDIEDLRINKLRPATKTALLNAALADGIGDVLATLQDDMHLGVAVVSNSPRMRIQPLLDKHGLDTRIPKSRVFSAFEDAAKLKEDPEIYHIASDTLTVPPAEAAAVEDSVTGMRAAKSAGIGLRIGFTGLTEPENRAEMEKKLLAEGAHVVINDMRRLPGVIRNFKPGV
jgi:HAD superfamily hydrolase (TIGR01509 family)